MVGNSVSILGRPPWSNWLPTSLSVTILSDEELRAPVRGCLLCMGALARSIHTKGIRGVLSTGFGLIGRYGAGSSKMRANLRCLIELLERHDAVATLPITARTLERNLDTIHGLDTRRIEWALHGYRHVDYSTQHSDTFRDDVRAGKEVFRAARIPLWGYRAPYLRITDEHLRVLAAEGLSYDSSHSALVGELPRSSDDLDRILAYYDTDRDWAISEIEGVTEIPVCLPDDEMLVDRLGLTSERIAQSWISMAELATRGGHDLVLQLHPVRMGVCGDALERLLLWASGQSVKTATLRTIQAEPQAANPRIAVTGDVDEVTLADFYFAR